VCVPKAECPVIENAWVDNYHGAWIHASFCSSTLHKRGRTCGPCSTGASSCPDCETSSQRCQWKNKQRRIEAT